MKNNIFKFTLEELKQGKEKINCENLFKPDSSSFKEYQDFILNSYKIKT